MTTYAMPAWLQAAQIEFGIQKAAMQFRGPYNGTLQATDFVAERWVASVTLPPRRLLTSGAAEAFFSRLVGGVHWVSLYHMARPVPVGTMRGTPTLTSAIARGDLSMSFSGCTPGSTMKAGDMFGATQLFQVADDATANGGGVMVVNVVNRVRAAVAGSTAIVWNKPTATFAMPATSARHVYVPGALLGGVIDLEEAW